MQCNRLLKKVVLLLAATSLLLCHTTTGVFADTDASKEGSTSELTVTMEETDNAFTMENDRYVFSLNKDAYDISLEDKSTTAVWKSTPDGAQEDEIAAGKERTNLRSVLVLSYLNTEKQLVDTINTATGCVAYNDATGESIQTVRIKSGDGFVTVYYVFSALKIVVPVRFSLADDGLICTIVTGEIVEEAEFHILTITLLPYFGAAGTADKGYLLLPDGSGALAYFNSGKETYATYEQPVYGRDESFDILMDTNKVQSIRLPVFGINKTKAGLLGILTEGEALATIKASVNGQKSSYSQVCPVFTVRSTYIYTMGESSAHADPQSVTVYEEKVLKETEHSLTDFTVKYCPLDADSCEYSGMARVYRQHLMKTTDITEGTTAASVHLEFPGAVRTSGKLFGLNIYSTKALNTTEDIAAVTDTMLENGVENIAIKLTDWTKQQIKGQISTKASLLSKLGGNGGLATLLADLGEKQVTLHLDTDYYGAANLQFPFFKGSYAARNVSRKTVQKYTYELASGLRDPYCTPTHLIAPSAMNKLAQTFMKAFQKRQGAQLSVGDMTSWLASDFADSGWTRTHSQTAVQEALATLSENSTMMIQGGNAYALPYADMVIDAPGDSSHFNLTDETVPFYQIAVNGLVSYSYEPVNGSADPETLLLKSIETGAALHFYFVSRNEEALPNTAEYSKYVSVDPSYWCEKVGEYYKQMKEVADAADGSAMVAHRLVANDVYETTWANGCRVLVNYRSTDVKVEGTTVPARGYCVLAGGDKG